MYHSYVNRNMYCHVYCSWSIMLLNFVMWKCNLYLEMHLYKALLNTSDIRNYLYEWFILCCCNTNAMRKLACLDGRCTKWLLTLLNRLYGEWTHPCWYLLPLEFTLYFPVYGLYCYFWHDCTPVSDSTWCRNVRTLKNIAYPRKNGPWFVLPQYMIECR